MMSALAISIQHCVEMCGIGQVIDKWKENLETDSYKYVLTSLTSSVSTACETLDLKE